jgi:GR25 family glycosyltransferase involved in LPS biosynthesis
MIDFCVYGIIAPHETERMPSLQAVMAGFTNHRMVNAIFPKYCKVPWVKQLLQQSFMRCHRHLNLGELGCLLSHRKTWKTFLKSGYDYGLILESDSTIKDNALLQHIITAHAGRFDILFLGSYHGRTKVKRSTSESFGKMTIGEPLPNTLYCTYGYVMQKTAAKHLLRQTGKVSWPVDFWSKWLADDRGTYQMRVGAVAPEVISTWDAPSTIQDIRLVRSAEQLPRRIKYFLGEVKNSLIGFMS